MYKCQIGGKDKCGTCRFWEEEVAPEGYCEDCLDRECGIDVHRASSCKGCGWKISSASSVEMMEKDDFHSAKSRVRMCFKGEASLEYCMQSALDYINSLEKLSTTEFLKLHGYALNCMEEEWLRRYETKK